MLMTLQTMFDFAQHCKTQVAYFDEHKELMPHNGVSFRARLQTATFRAYWDLLTTICQKWPEDQHGLKLLEDVERETTSIVFPNGDRIQNNSYYDEFQAVNGLTWMHYDAIESIAMLSLKIEEIKNEGKIDFN